MPEAASAWNLYEIAVDRALVRLRESERLCARIDAVADAAHRLVVVRAL